MMIRSLLLPGLFAAEGAAPRDIVKLTFYVAAKPASPPITWGQVAGLARPEYLVEIDAVAAAPAGLK
jgi:hypothetical protein